MLAAQQARLSALTASAQVQSLVRELKSHKSCSAAKNNNSKNEILIIIRERFREKKKDTVMDNLWSNVKQIVQMPSFLNSVT